MRLLMLKHRDRVSQLVLSHLPALLLILVALVQIGLAWGGGRLNPDKGGGFGMFSTVDRLNHRHLRAYRIGPEGEEALTIHPGHPLRSAVRRATSFPSDNHLHAVAGQLIQQQHHHRHRISAVRVEVWKSSFDPSGLLLRPLPVAALTVDQAGR